MTFHQTHPSKLRELLQQRPELRQFCPTSTDYFYTNLPVLKAFEQTTDIRNYADVPLDWYILVANIAKSIRAIEEGRYKAVTFLGVSSIVAVLNVSEGLEIPFAFGGDGAAMLVPPGLLALARDALLGLKQKAQTEFNLVLRVGVVPVSGVTSKQHTVKITKLRISEHYTQANFLGGGLSYAINLIKDDRPDNPYQIQVPVGQYPSLVGLECRWQDIYSTPKQTLSVVLAPGLGESGAVYREFVEAVHHIYGQRRNLSPIKSHQLKLSLNPQKLILETRLRSRSNRLRHRLAYLGSITLQNLLGWFLMKYKMQAGGVDWGKYKDDIAITTDYRKVDDVLRMIIVSQDWQTEQLTRYLQDKFEQSELTYGIHTSDRMLITCLVFERHGQQVHFVDGADGGYAIAAEAMKQRLRQVVIG